jgi:hypothetical protein
MSEKKKTNDPASREAHRVVCSDLFSYRNPIKARDRDSDRSNSAAAVRSPAECSG